MIVHFEDRDWKLDVDEIDVAQAMYIKVKTGFNLLQWQAALEQADVDALRALYWLMLEQNGVRKDISLINFKIVQFGRALKDAQKDEGEPEENPTVPKQNAG